MVTCIIFTVDMPSQMLQSVSTWYLQKQPDVWFEFIIIIFQWWSGKISMLIKKDIIIVKILSPKEISNLEKENKH